MLAKISSFLEERKKSKREDKIRRIASDKKNTLLIATNKELCEVTPFIDLLDLFEYYPLKGHYLQQNVNSNLLGLKKNIYETCLYFEKLVKNLKSKNLSTVSSLPRISRLTTESYLFFSEKNDVSYNTFDQRSLDQLVEWMRDITLYFDAYKSSMNEFDEAYCLVIYGNLDVYFDFFYSLLCHVGNIKCDHYLKISVFVNEDF